MKVTDIPNLKHKAGMTLLELTVVILVLLSLISILFVGARAWMKGSDRSANILNIRNVQQAVRSYANIHNVVIGGACPVSAIVGTNQFLLSVTPPNPSISYAYDSQVPAAGVLYLQCSYATPQDELVFSPTPGTTDDW